MEINEITGGIVDSAIRVHSVLGPGFLESTHEACLKHELSKRKMKCVSQVAMPVIYDGVEIEIGYRIDLLVEDSVIVELKAIEKLVGVHESQLLSYLKLSGKRVGLLINFNVKFLKDGIKRLIND